VRTDSRVVYQFGPFEVNVAAGELLKSGRRIRLQELPHRLLVALLEHPGEVTAGKNFEAASGLTIPSLILTAASALQSAS
jgi:DNA-binding winged helix-turn-helix (wHTH) protein